MSDRKERIKRREEIEKIFNHHAMLGVKDPQRLGLAIYERAEEQGMLLKVPYLQKENTSLFVTPGPEIGTCVVLTKRYDPIRAKNIYGFEKKSTDLFSEDVFAVAVQKRKHLENILTEEDFLASQQESEDQERHSGVYTAEEEKEVLVNRTQRMKEIRELYGEDIVKEIQDLHEYQKFIAEYNRMTGDGAMAHHLADSRAVGKALLAEWKEDDEEDRHIALASYALINADKIEQGTVGDVTGINMTGQTAADAVLKSLLRPQKQN